MMAMTCFSALFSCEQKNVDIEEPPVPLSNEINYCDSDTIAVRSVIYEKADDGYTFYLSATEGLATVEEITAQECLIVKTDNVSGSLDAAKDTYSVSFRDITAESGSSSFEMSVTLASSLKLAIDLETASGKILEVAYDGKCSEAALPELDNEFELDGSAKSVIKSEVAVNVPGKYSRYLFYADGDDEASLEIRVADGADVSDVDLSSADNSQISIICGEFDSSKGVEGTLDLDEFNGETMVSMDAISEGHRLRMAYSGKAERYYESSNIFKVTYDGATEESAVSKVFRYEQSGGNLFAMGLADAEAPADLMNGRYAVVFRVGSLSMGETIDISADASKCSFELYDYETYSVWDINKASGEGATGTLTVIESEGEYYVSYSIQFKDGPLAEGEWAGATTSVDEEFNIVPVEPFVSKITITSPDDATLLDWGITSLELRHDTEFRDSYTGDIISGGYIFYFVNEYTSNVEDATTTPYFILPDEYVGCENLDLKAEGDKIKWSFKFNNSNLSQYSGYGYNSSWAKRCPDKATLTVKKEDKEWTFLLMIEDYGMFGYSQTGTKNVLRVEWKGQATKYSGTKNNDMGDDEY